MTDTPADRSSVNPVRKRKTRLLWGCLCAPAALVGLLAAVAVITWNVENYRVSRELQVEIQKLRARGEPLTTVELNDYYVAAPDRPDMTDEIMAALAICDSKTNKPTFKRVLGNDKAKTPLPTEPWEKLPEAEALLTQFEPAFETFDEVARRDGTARFPVDLCNGVFSNVDHVEEVRWAAQLLNIRCRVDRHHGRHQRALDDILAILALSRTFEPEPMMVAHLVRTALVGLAINDLEAVLKIAEFDDDALHKIQAVLRDLPIEQCLQTAFVGERASGYTSCLDPVAFTSRERRMSPDEVKQIVRGSPKRRHDAVMIIKLNGRIIDAADSGLPAALHEATKVEQELRQLAKSKRNQLLYILTPLQMPACEAAVSAFARTAATRDSADAAIAAERYRLAHGKWPETLTELVPDYLPAVPIDPFSGRELLMRQSDTEFKVQSVGYKRLKDIGFAISRGSPKGEGPTSTIESKQ